MKNVKILKFEGDCSSYKETFVSTGNLVQKIFGNIKQKSSKVGKDQFYNWRMESVLKLRKIPKHYAHCCGQTFRTLIYDEIFKIYKTVSRSFD